MSEVPSTSFYPPYYLVGCGVWCIYEVYRVYQVIINYNPRWLSGVSRKLPFVALLILYQSDMMLCIWKHDTNSTKNMMVTMHEIRYERGRKRPMPDR